MNPDDVIGLVGMSGFIFLVFMFIVMRSAVKMNRIKETETSRREIAAYVAEGSMTPEDGERLLGAGNESGGPSC